MSDDVERWLAAQLAVTKALAESSSIGEAIERTLSAIGTHLGWPAGTFWLRDGLRNVLYAARILGDADSEFARVTMNTTFECGVGLPGRVWDDRRAIWEADVASLESFPRAGAAVQAGLHGAVALPVATHEEFLGVIELFSERSEPHPESLRSTLEIMGIQVGQFIARQRAMDAGTTARQLATAVIEAALDCIVTIDAESRVLEFNPAAERTFGYRREDVLGKPMVDLIVPRDLRDAHRQGMARYLATGTARVLGKRIEIRACRANGESFPVELTILRVGGDGPPIFTAYLRDLTEQKRLERDNALLLGASAILSASLDYQETLRNLSRIVVPAFADWYAVDVLNASGTLDRLEVAHRDPEKVSAALEIAARYPDDPNTSLSVQVIRTGRSQLLPEIPEAMLVQTAQNEEHLSLLRQLGLRSAIVVPLRTGSQVAGAITLITAESERHYDERDVIVAEDLARRAGEAIEKATLFSEVSDAREQLEQQAIELEAQSAELQQTAAELHMAVERLSASNEALRLQTTAAEEARGLADEANRAKSDFLASMSHELRTPLNAIMGYAQLLELGVHGTLDERQREDLRRIDRSAQHLLGLITDILNFAKIEAGKLEYDLERIQLARVLERVEEMIAPQAAAKHLSYSFVNTCIDAHVCADEEKLLQIFVNVVSNALRYTPEGGRITVECRATEDSVFTDVCDTGAGIPADRLDAIFEPFVQANSGYAGEHEGTGLGLAISRDLARRMGGDLTVRSTIGVGSVFTLRLAREP